MSIQVSDRKLAAELAEITKCDDIEKLIGIVKGSLEICTRQIIVSAAAIGQIRKLGGYAEIEGIDPDYFHYLSLVSDGSLLPELFVKFITSDDLDKMCRLSLADQQKVLNDEPFKVMVSKKDHRMFLFQDMDGYLQDRVFTKNGRLRSEPEQIALLESKSKEVVETSQGDEPMFHAKASGDIKVIGECTIPKSFVLMLAEKIKEGRRIRIRRKKTATAK